MEGEETGDVKDSVAQPLGLTAGEVSGEEESLHPDVEIVCELHDLEPDAVVLEVFEGQVAHAGVLVVSDVILDVRAGAVAALDLCDLAALVGEDRLEAMTVMV